MLSEFTTALTNLLAYEENNHAAELADSIRDIQNRVETILEALSNITGVQLQNEVSPTEEVMADNEDSSDTEVTYLIDQSSSPSISGSHRDSRDTSQQDNNGIPSASTMVSLQITSYMQLIQRKNCV